MSDRTQAIGGVIMLVIAFATGRWMAPEKVKIETRTVEVEKKDNTLQQESDRNKRRETTKTTVTRPDGTTETTEKTLETSDAHKATDKHDTTITEATTEVSKEVTRGTAKVTIAAMAGIDLAPGTRPPVLYGAMISKPILGPITVGVFGLTGGTFGGILGLTF